MNFDFKISEALKRNCLVNLLYSGRNITQISHGKLYLFIHQSFYSSIYPYIYLSLSIHITIDLISRLETQLLTRSNASDIGSLVYILFCSPPGDNLSKLELVVCVYYNQIFRVRKKDYFIWIKGCFLLVFIMQALPREKD